MAEIPAESTVWRRIGAEENETPQTFPEAHRGEWLHDPHYARLRDEHCRLLDDDYVAWRRERFGREFEAWRNAQPERQPEPQPQPQPEPQQDRRDTGTFFERS